MRKYFISIGILSIVVFLIVVIGIFQINPSSSKDIKLDEERINNFIEISNEIDDYFMESEKLPKDLAILVDFSNKSDLKINDPKTKEVYEYKTVSSISYHLCTEFSTDSKEVSKEFDEYYFYDRYGGDFNYNHAKGKDCIELEVDEYVLDDLEEDRFLSNNNNSTSTSQNSIKNNTKRRSDITQILNAIGAYAADNGGALPSDITSEEQEISDFEADICLELVNDYITALPVDPEYEFDYGDEPITDCDEIYDTGYNVSKSSDNRVTVSAPLAENGEVITNTR